MNKPLPVYSRATTTLPTLVITALALILSACTGPALADESSPATVRLLPRKYIDGSLFGGLSGLAWDSSANALIAISDREDIYQLPMRADEEVRRIGRLNTPKGVEDSEALRRIPSGDWLVAFEGGGAILRYRGDAAGLTKAPVSSLRPKALRKLPYNAGIEALALLDFGRMLAIAEGGRGDHRKAWIIDNGQLYERAYPVSDKFEPVDAIGLPNGDVLVLERRFNGFLPPFFSARIARIRGQDLDGDGPFKTPQRLDLKGVLPAENWEGLALSEDNHRMTLWLVSDDNQKWPQHTLLAKISLEDFRQLEEKR